MYVEECQCVAVYVTPQRPSSCFPGGQDALATARRVPPRPANFLCYPSGPGVTGLGFPTQRGPGVPPVSPGVDDTQLWPWGFVTILRGEAGGAHHRGFAGGLRCTGVAGM